MTIAPSSALVQRVEEIKGLVSGSSVGLILKGWVLKNSEEKGGGQIKRKSEVKQELVWGSEGREEEQSTQKGEDSPRGLSTRSRERDKMAPGAIFSFWNGSAERLASSGAPEGISNYQQTKLTSVVILYEQQRVQKNHLTTNSSKPQRKGKI